MTTPLTFTPDLPTEAGEYFHRYHDGFGLQTVRVRMVDGAGLVCIWHDNQMAAIDQTVGEWLRIPSASELVAIGERMERMERALELAENAIAFFDEGEPFLMVTEAIATIQEARKS